MINTLERLRRGLLLRCPVCGKGKLFSHGFTMYKECPVCHFVYEREEGYFSGAMAVNLVISELLIAAVTVPIAVWVGMNPTIPILPLFLVGLPMPFLLPFLFYRHSRGFWMSGDLKWHPPSPSEFRNALDNNDIHNKWAER